MLGGVQFVNLTDRTGNSVMNLMPFASCVSICSLFTRHMLPRPLSLVPRCWSEVSPSEASCPMWLCLKWADNVRPARLLRPQSHTTGTDLRLHAWRRSSASFQDDLKINLLEMTKINWWRFFHSGFQVVWAEQLWWDVTWNPEDVRQPAAESDANTLTLWWWHHHRLSQTIFSYFLCAPVPHSANSLTDRSRG